MKEVFFCEADINAGCFFGGGLALDPNLIVMLEVYTWLMGAIQVCKIVLTEHLCACLKGQCHKINIFFEGLNNLISTFYMTADGF
jgi:hypothetical protein